MGRWVSFATWEGDDETDAGNVTYQRKSAFCLLCCSSSEGSSLRVSFPDGLEASEDLAYNREIMQHHLQSVGALNFLRRRLNRESARSAKLLKNSEMGCCLWLWPVIECFLFSDFHLLVNQSCWMWYVWWYSLLLVDGEVGAEDRFLQSGLYRRWCYVLYISFQNLRFVSFSRFFTNSSTQSHNVLAWFLLLCLRRHACVHANFCKQNQWRICGSFRLLIRNSGG